MERCPNCGAPTRPGAKFCTTCGYRLTDETDGPVATTPGEDAPSGDVASAASAWATPPTEAAADDPPPPADVAVASEAAAEDGPIPPATDGDDGASPREGDAGVDDDAGPEAADQVLSSSWPSPDAAAWSAGWGMPREPVAPTAASEATPTTAADPGSTPSNEEEAPSPGTSVAWGAQADPPTDPVAFAPDSGATLPPAAPLVDEPDADAPAADPSILATDEREEPPFPDTFDDPGTRAAALVEELRALLPVLSAAPEIDADAVAADLAAALPTDADAAANDRDLLRAALRAVRDRPRDIDAMLDLAVRADPLLTLLDAHDEALAAIDRALAVLRPDPA